MNAPATPEQVATTTAVVEYSETRAGLAELRGRLENVVFDCTTSEGDDAARKARRECVTLRTTLDKLRLKKNEEDQNRIKGRNRIAQEIEAEIRALEDPIDKEIKAQEAKVAAAKAERDRVEQERIAGIHRRIAWISGRVSELAGAPAKQVDEAARQIEQLPITPDLYGEFVAQAAEARMNAVKKLDAMTEVARKNEREAIELAERKRILDEKQAALDAEDKQRLEKRKLEDAERAAAQKAEDDARAERIRLEDEERARQRKADDDRRAAEEAERARKEQEAAAERKRQREALEDKANPWAALARIETLASDAISDEPANDPREALAEIAEECDAVEQYREKLAALDAGFATAAAAARDGQAKEAGLRG